MTEVERILDQLRRTFEGEAWHGPAVLKLLEGVGPDEADAHPVGNAHSIWELVLHIAAWKDACRRRLNGDPAQLSDAEDWPPVTDVSDESWLKTREKLIESHSKLVESVTRIEESRLDEPIVADPTIAFSSVYVTLQGVVQHDLYHAGQIALLKKALAE